MVQEMLFLIILVDPAIIKIFGWMMLIVMDQNIEFKNATTLNSVNTIVIGKQSVFLYSAEVGGLKQLPKFWCIIKVNYKWWEMMKLDQYVTISLINLLLSQRVFRCTEAMRYYLLNLVNLVEKKTSGLTTSYVIQEHLHYLHVFMILLGKPNAILLIVVYFYIVEIMVHNPMGLYK